MPVQDLFIRNGLPMRVYSGRNDRTIMRTGVGITIVIFTFLLLSCQGNDNRVIVDFNSPTHDSTHISFHEDEAVHVAIASISSPRESYRYYNELLDYIASKIHIPIHTIQKQSYKEVNQLLLDGAVDFAFISTGAYINLEENNEIKLLVAPVINNDNHYRAYLITPRHSSAEGIEDLKNSSFAFSDPLSNTGYYYPLYRLKELGENKAGFFAQTMFSFGHDLSIEMVNREIVDGAYVHGLIYDFLGQQNHEKISNTRIIEISEPFGIPPIVCPKKLDGNKFRLYQEIFLNLHTESTGKAILDRLNIDRYEKVNDNLYQSVRTIKNSISDEDLEFIRIQ